jgi:hypothetical protein
MPTEANENRPSNPADGTLGRVFQATTHVGGEKTHYERLQCNCRRFIAKAMRDALKQSDLLPLSQVRMIKNSSTPGASRIPTCDLQRTHWTPTGRIGEQALKGWGLLSTA